MMDDTENEKENKKENEKENKIEEKQTKSKKEKIIVTKIYRAI